MDSSLIGPLKIINQPNNPLWKLDNLKTLSLSYSVFPALYNAEPRRKGTCEIRSVVDKFPEINTGKKIAADQAKPRPRTKPPSKKTTFKHKDTFKDLKKQKNQDGLLRMAFLYQIAAKCKINYPGLSWKYMHDLNQVSEKLVIRV